MLWQLPQGKGSTEPEIRAPARPQAIRVAPSPQSPMGAFAAVLPLVCCTEALQAVWIFRHALTAFTALAALAALALNSLALSFTSPHTLHLRRVQCPTAAQANFGTDLLGLHTQAGPEAPLTNACRDPAPNLPSAEQDISAVLRCETARSRSGRGQEHATQPGRATLSISHVHFPPYWL